MESKPNERSHFLCITTSPEGESLFCKLLPTLGHRPHVAIKAPVSIQTLKLRSCDLGQYLEGEATMPLQF